MAKLTPGHAARRSAEQKAEIDRKNARAAQVKANRKNAKKTKAQRTKLFNELQGGLTKSFKDAEDLLLAEEKAGKAVVESEEEDDE